MLDLPYAGRPDVGQGCGKAHSGLFASSIAKISKGGPRRGRWGHLLGLPPDREDGAGDGRELRRKCGLCETSPERRAARIWTLRHRQRAPDRDALLDGDVLPDQRRPYTRCGSLRELPYAIHCGVWAERREAGKVPGADAVPGVAA